MAQTTASITGALGAIAISFDAGVTYTDISGSTTSIDGIEFARSSGSKPTFQGNYHIITVGKQIETSITVNCLYTETVNEAAALAISAIKVNKKLVLRWQYADVTTTPGATYLEYTTLGSSRVTKANLPVLDSESGEPAVLTFTVLAPGIDYTTITVPTPP